MMNELLQTHVFLTAGLRDDPLLCLASTVSWLDPFWQDDADAWDLSQDEEDTLALALRVMRTTFPEIYVQGVERRRRGASYTDLEHFICGEISALGIPLESLEWVGYSVPLPAYGVLLDEPDFYTAHPDVIPVLECFGVLPHGDPDTLDVPEHVYTAGRLIAADLERHSDERYRQVSRLVQWLFSCSGNSIIDVDYDTIGEYEALLWDKDDLAFAIAMIQEAEGMLQEIHAGLTFLNGQPAVLSALQNNVQRIYRAIRRQKGIRNHESHIRLAWPCPTNGAERAP